MVMSAKIAALGTLGRCLGLIGALAAQTALAADADNGKHVAELRCSPCHIVVSASA